MRIGGLASGMDIDTMVKDLMKAERIPLDKLKQKKQLLEWQRDDFRAINTLLLNFRSDLTNIKLTSNYRARSTTSTDDTKVTATATSTASLASYSISSVEKLASAAVKVTDASTGKISTSGSKVNVNASLYDETTKFSNQTFSWKTGSVTSQTIVAPESGTPIKISLKEGVSVDTTAPINIKVNGVSYEVVGDSESLDSSKKQVFIDDEGNFTFSNSIAKGSSIKVDYIASNSVQEIKTSAETDSFTITKNAIASSSNITGITIGGEAYTLDGNQLLKAGEVVGSMDSNGKVTLLNDTKLAAGTEINISYKEQYTSFSLQTYGANNTTISENFNISATESLSSVINKVNTSSVGVTMFYDSVADRMTLTSKTTGDFNTGGDEIVTSGDLINKVLRFETASETGGENAVFTINGLRTERPSNTFEISGVTFTLKKQFTVAEGGVSVNINNNTSKTLENIKGFIAKYNELIGKIQGEVQEDRYKSYTPLTDEQRESLSDTQQEQWEEKAKSGMLRRDPILSSVLTKMRFNFSNPVASQEISSMYNQLASIGIKTTANYLEGGKLEIDEAKLTKALEQDPISVEKLFNATGGTDGQKGILNRLTDTVNDALNKLRTKAGNSFTTNKQFAIGKQIDDVNTRISKFEARLIKVEDRYWTQFTAMEKAIQRSNEQMNQLLNFSG
ncbi:flagellar filament capping protein FliD [Robertmurraya korlensis]|uniref:flagellar filament capping protein FliD n=1 Tax=Robertmurraya korlensis TaxID=519977 RepID=UPI00203BD28D|nr:flagellar filament capping protein FliD [Robertmurraya korlensis]MCM3602640.1 flagellar filament capping protein FliD [Robertmurraya korlensis]